MVTDKCHNLNLGVCMCVNYFVFACIQIHWNIAVCVHGKVNGQDDAGARWRVHRMLNTEAKVSPWLGNETGTGVG